MSDTSPADLALTGVRVIPWKDDLPAGFIPVRVIFGRDDLQVGEVQVAVATSSVRPSKGMLEAAHKKRAANTAMPVLLAIVHAAGVWLFDGDEPLGPLPHSQAERQLQAVLDEPHGIAAASRIKGIKAAYSSIGMKGFSNQFLFATYHLRVNVPRRPDWETARLRSEPKLTKRGTELITALGFEVEPAYGASQNVLVLRGTSGSRRAIAVLLDESENFGQKSVSYQLSPEAKALEVASREEVPWVIGLRQSTLRLYPGRDGVGVGQRGQSETFFELDLALVDPEYAGLLDLIFSAQALEKGGTTEEILDGSGRYAADLGARLRDRVYLGVVPRLAIAVAERLPALDIAVDAEGLQVAYRLSMRILFRLLFQAYGEATELLPAGRNEHYDANSLRTFVARELHTSSGEFAEAASSIWRDLTQVWDAIAQGNPRWEIPAYGGSLFDPSSEEGKQLERLQLPDSVMGPALQAMLTEVTEDGVTGAVDFRSLQVREFGTIYEGLLESSLSLAEGNLATDRAGIYVPAGENDEVFVRAGEPYFHSASGERKATGSYYTPKIVVDHLIERSVEPALEAHLDRVKTLMDQEREREAGELFFDFRVADLAMGSAHFLVAAVDKIERGMRDFLTVTPVPGVRAELQRLAGKAQEALGPDVQAARAITEAQLLRRQVARRCIYGLDINPLAVELSRLALWIHTFVPGLPMSSLDHGIVLANSLTGMTSVEEALSALDPRRVPGASGFFDSVLIDELEGAKSLFMDFGRASEADKAEVAAGAQLLRAAQQTSATAKSILDAAVAVRSGRIDGKPRFTRDDLDELLREKSLGEVTQRLAPGHFPYLFPEVFLREDPGFDVIVGNPPWDKVRWEAAPYWAKVSPGLMALPDTVRDDRIEQLRTTRPSEAARERHEIADREQLQAYFKQVFEWRGGTHLELAQLMLERALKALRRQGRLGLVLPRQSLVLAGWKNLREQVILSHDVDLVQARNSAGWMFENVDARYAVVLLAVRPLADSPICVSVAQSAEAFALLDSKSAVSFTRDELASFSETLVVPWFDAPEDRQVFEKLRSGDRLGTPGGWVTATHDARWDFRGTGPDRSLASRVQLGESWSVMMTRHVDQFAIRDTPVKQFISDWSGIVGKERGVVLQPGGSAEFTKEHPSIIFRHPSRSDDTRTLIATALPSTGYIYNKGYIHALAHVAGTAEDELLALLGVVSTNVTDWWARRFVDRHVTAPVINNLPIPFLNSDSISEIADRVSLLLTSTGYKKLAGGIDVEGRAGSSRFATDTRLGHLGAIEAIVAHGHGLTDQDLSIVKSDFSTLGMGDELFALALQRLSQLREEEK